MTRLKPWIVLSLVFVTGIVVGIAGTRIAVKRIIARTTANPELVRERIEREFARELRLTPEQRPKVHEIFQRSHEEIRTLRQDFQPRVADVLKRSEQEIRAVLNDAQREKFDRWLEKKPFVPRALLPGQKATANPDA